MIRRPPRVSEHSFPTRRSSDLWTIRWEPGTDFRINIWQDASELWDLGAGSVVVIEGRWSAEFRNIAIGDSDDVKVLKRVSQHKARSVA